MRFTALSEAARGCGLNSFWMGGFEGADHRSSSGYAHDCAAVTGHLKRLEHDYSLLARVGMRTVRESVGWRLTETASGVFDFTRLHRLLEVSERQNTQVLWTLMHYGVPQDVDFWGEAFLPRFVDFATRVAEQVRDRSTQAPIYTPINEINFLSWAVTHSALIFPYQGTQDEAAARLGYQLKRRLAHASIVAMRAIREVDPRARFMVTEPVVHVVASDDAPQWQDQAKIVRDYQWQAWDMISGRSEPQLGGSPDLLDFLGVNHYHSSQWELPSEQRLWWHLRDARRVPFSQLLSEAHTRYERPIIVAETSHVGVGRAAWIDENLAEVRRAQARGVPVVGWCWYPVMDRPDWEVPAHWHNCGLWDLPACAEDTRMPTLHFASARTLKRWQRRFERTPSSAHLPKGSSMRTLIVFSHLRWDFVYQRPQQLMSRLARRYRIVFVEEPLHGPHEPYLERYSPAHNIEVVRPHSDIAAPGFHDDQLAKLKPLLTQYLRDFDVKDYAVWLYTPMALPLVSELNPQAVIYDCMDELSAFKDAPRQMVQREHALLKRADLVFTGGVSLYEQRRDSHPNVHCVPSAVAKEHYTPHDNTLIHNEEARALQTHIDGPRLGFFGVIDERIDYGLIEALARARSDWHIVMVGPIVKVDSATLPRLPNIHYLGQQPYSRLPALVATWDVCLLPFALNAATRFISPTKTLEYMAAERPVVSTAIRDVEALYREVVAVAANHDAFIEACERLLDESDAAREARVIGMREHVERNSWDAAVRHVMTQMERLPLSRQGESAVPDRAATAISAPVRALPTVTKAPQPRRVQHLIIGAGPTGLAAARELGQDALLIEREPRVGGWCRSVTDNGFTFDYAGHIMFSKDPFVLSLYEELLGDNMHWQNREAWVYSKGVYTRYPFQGALYGLPTEVLTECLLGAIEAREQAQLAPNQSPQNFEEFIHQVWGRGIAKHFAIPYNQKLWAVPLHDMETSWLGGRVPMPDLAQMIEGALTPTPPPMGPNARFGYPLRGGFQALMDAFVPKLKGELWLDTSCARVSPKHRTVSLTDGRNLRYDTLISTMPLPQLIAACGDEAPEDVRAAANALQHVSVRCVNFGIGREHLTDKHWIYYPEDTVFHRIFVQGNASPYCNPPGGFGITCEITYSAHKPLPCYGQALIDRALADCIKVGMVRADDKILAANLVDMPCAYVVYDHARAQNVQRIRQWLDQYDIILAGRYSEWEYYNSDHAFVAGRKAAMQAQARVENAVSREATSA